MKKKILVIGNGFDLAAGAKTLYKHFFESDDFKSTKENAVRWIKYCLFNANYTRSSLSSLFPDDSSPFNCWDLLFCMKSSHIDQLGCYMSINNWCEIEQVIHDSFIQNGKVLFSWKVVYDYLHNLRVDYMGEALDYPSGKENNIMFKFLLSKGWKDKADSLSHFYNELLVELGRFERTFGLYISSVTEESATNDYQFKASRIAEQLISDTGDVIVDSFNYSTFISNASKIRHINGNTDNPIFGIELSDKEKAEYPEARCFTKTFRRLQQEATHKSDLFDSETDSVQGAVVFGHSLNTMDYDYFYYLFTSLHFNSLDIGQMGRIEFVYKRHGDKPDKNIFTFTDKVYKILNSYEEYVNHSCQHILINMLRFSGKLKIWELN